MKLAPPSINKNLASPRLRCKNFSPDLASARQLTYKLPSLVSTIELPRRSLGDTKDRLPQTANPFFDLTAASRQPTAGVVGGALLLDGIRSAFGHHLGGTIASAADREQDRQQDLADDDREQDRQQDLADDDREQDRQQDLADDDREQDAEQDLADEDAQQDSEQDLTDDEDIASGDDFSDDGYDT
jgi:hypothetical protein